MAVHLPAGLELGLCQDLKFAFYTQSSYNSTEFKQEVLVNISGSRCAKLIMFPRRFAAVIVASSGSTKYLPNGVST